MSNAVDEASARGESEGDMFTLSESHIHFCQLHNPGLFSKILGELKEKIPCEIKIMERTHVWGYRTESSSEYAIFSRHLDEGYIKKLLSLIMERGWKGKIWLWIGHLFHLSEEETHNSKLVEGLMELYDFIYYQK